MSHIDLPSNLSPAELVPAINDALRRIALSPASSTTTNKSSSTVAPAATGGPGAPVDVPSGTGRLQAAIAGLP